MDQERKDRLAEAVEIAGSQTALGDAIGVQQQAIWRWLNLTGKVPAEYCYKIQDFTRGAVKAYDLRPDVFKQPRKRKSRAQ